MPHNPNKQTNSSIFKQFNLAFSHLFTLSLNVKLLFNLSIRPYQVLPPRARGDLGAMAIKENSAFLKAPSATFSVISRTLLGGESYPKAEIRSVYSTNPTDCVPISEMDFTNL